MCLLFLTKNKVPGRGLEPEQLDSPTDKPITEN
jgi:hypothetical protein